MTLKENINKLDCTKIKNLCFSLMKMKRQATSKKSFALQKILLKGWNDKLQIGRKYFQTMYLKMGNIQNI